MVELVLRQRWSTGDPAVASEAVRSVFGVGRITTAGGDFAFEQRALVDDGISVTRIASRGTGVRLIGNGSPDLVVVAVRSGSMRLRAGRDQVRLEPPGLGLIPFAGSVELAWDDVAADLYGFPLSSFGRVLGSAEHRIAVSAPFLAPQSADLAQLWLRMAGTVAEQVLDKAVLYERDVVRSQMIEALTAITVETFGLVNSDETGASLEDDALSRAETYLRTRIGDPISVLDIAASAGLSVRGLQGLYQRRFGVSPIARLRRMRLEGARAALRSPGAGTTVGAVARRFGYSNLGRFSAHYRDQWGELPSRTLEVARTGDGDAPTRAAIAVDGAIDHPR